MYLSRAKCQSPTLKCKSTAGINDGLGGPRGQNDRLTVTRIVEITHMTRGSAQEFLEALEVKGLVTSTWVKNAMGRGKAREYRIRDGIRLSKGFFLTLCGSSAVSENIAMGGHAEEIEMVARPRG